VKLAFVDLDYTVLVNPFWPAVFPHFARHVAARSPSEPSEPSVIDDLMARSKALSLRRDVAANDWDRLMGECAAAAGVAWCEPVAELVERYRSFAREVPGARAMLADLRAAGWTCVAASAGYRRFQLPSLAHLGLLDCFDGLRFADDAGTLKRRLGFYGAIAPEVTHVACVGDSYVDDCLYPAHFGFATVWFTGARPSAPLRCGRRPSARVERLDDVAGALREVAASSSACYRMPPSPACPTCDGPGGESGGPCSLCRCLASRYAEQWDGDRPPDRS
jgi:FMN phosphatase YigB (HAD superfamily)